MGNLPKALSVGEEEFALHCRMYGLAPVREFVFAPPRKWRADFAFVDERVLVEIEGGVWSGGRHTTGSGFTADLQKYNQASLDGWRLFRFTPGMVASAEAIDCIRKALR